MKLLLLSLCLFALGSTAWADRDEAIKLYKQGFDATDRGQFPEAVDFFSRAIVADPTWGMARTERGLAYCHLGENARALADFAKGAQLCAAEKDAHGEENALALRADTLEDMDRWVEALECADAALKLEEHTTARIARGRALCHLGDIDGGIAEMRKCESQEVNTPYFVAHALLLKADWAAAMAEARKLAGTPAESGVYEIGVYALVEMGKYEDARQMLETYVKKKGSTYGTGMAEAYYYGTPGVPTFDPAKALRACGRVNQKFSTWEVVNLQARIYFLNGRYSECANLLETRGTRLNFESNFWFGAAAWALGRFAEARIALRDARRMNPSLLDYAKRIPEMQPWLQSIDREVSSEFEAAKAGTLGFELATHVMTVAEIETLARGYQFQRAQAEYEKLLPTLTSRVRKAELERRIADLADQAVALQELVNAVNKGSGSLKTKVGANELTLVKADDRAFDFTIPKGSGKFPWAFLDATEFYKFASAQKLTNEQRFALAELLWDAGEDALAQKELEAPAKNLPGLKDRLGALVARKRGIEAPAGGFVFHKGQWVTAEEKANLEKGLVAWRGRWVTPADRDNLRKGKTLVSGKWVVAEETDLIRNGFRKTKDGWASEEDLAALHSKWATAWEEETAHFKIRTNYSEAFAKDLASVAEAAWEALKKFHGAEPKAGDKLSLWAFRTFEDYRRHCVETKQEQQLNAAGFASPTTNLAVAWNKTGNAQLFLEMMIHESAHLYYAKAFPSAKPPSWLSEGMATYFEGFAWGGDTWRFTFLPAGRQALVHGAAEAGTTIPLEDLLKSDALQLLDKDPARALLFFSECWSLQAWLSGTDDAALQSAFEGYRKSVSAGKEEPLSKFIPDLAKLEKDWLAFVKGH